MAPSRARSAALYLLDACQSTHSHSAIHIWLLGWIVPVLSLLPVSSTSHHIWQQSESTSLHGNVSCVIYHLIYIKYKLKHHIHRYIFKKLITLLKIIVSENLKKEKNAKNLSFLVMEIILTCDIAIRSMTDGRSVWNYMSMDNLAWKLTAMFFFNYLSIP